MRTSRKNKQKMYFANYDSATTLYERDSEGNIIYETYTDSDGTVYTYAKELGVSTAGYHDAQEMYANISMSGGDAQAREYGMDVSQYSAIIICSVGAYDIDEKSLIWFKNEVGYKDAEQTEIDPKTADYRVIKVSPSLNYVKYILQRNVTDA